MKNIITTAAALATITGTAAAATSYSTDFDNFAVGFTSPQANGVPYINDPNPAFNWRGDGLTGLGGQGDYDAGIVNIGGARQNVFRQNNIASAQTGNYATTHPSTPVIDAAGETGTQTNSGAPSTNDVFQFSYDFKAVVDQEQDGLQVRTTPFDSGAGRQGIIYIEDGGSDGFRVEYADLDVAGNAFRNTTIASNLSRSDWHSLSVEMIFNDGAANDVVNITLNGNTTTLTTWEYFYRANSLAVPAVDSLIFRIPAQGSPVNAFGPGGGVYFDNLSTATVPAPGAAGLLGLAGLAATRRRR